MKKKEKRCTKCGFIKPVSAYGRKGKSYWCKECCYKYTKSWNEKNPEMKRQQSIKWRLANPEKVKARAKKWRSKNRDKIKLYAYFNYWHKGKVSSKKCAICKKQARDSHHVDYAFPLDVIYLCKSCHKKVHLQAD